VPAAADVVDVRQPSFRVDLAHAAPGVDEEYFPLCVYDDAGSRVSEGSSSE
jgi:hypothetical protein